MKGVLLAAVLVACGICTQDKIAATYDYHIVTTSQHAHHAMVFAALSGVNPTDAALKARLQQTAEAMPGVDRGTARASLSPAAISFSIDPAHTTVAAALAALNRHLAAWHIHAARLDFTAR